MTTPTDLNDILFAQLKRLESTTDLESEIARAKSIVDVSEQVVKNNTMRLDAAKLIAEYRGVKNADPVALHDNLIGCRGRRSWASVWAK